MKVITRLIFVRVTKNSIFVLMALVGLFAFFDLIGQSRQIGSTYSIWQAFQFTALVLPQRAYQVLPIAVLLGAIFTLAQLAQTSQFTILRVSGISPWSFCAMLMIPGILFVGMAYLIGEEIAPPAKRLQEEGKLDVSGNVFTGRDFKSGIWVRDVERDRRGMPTSVRFVNVGSLKPGEAAYNWEVYKFDTNNQLTGLMTAKQGKYSDAKGWMLEDVTEQTVPELGKDFRGQTEEKVDLKKTKDYVWGKSLDGNIFGLLMVKPENMSLQELYRYVQYLKENGQTFRSFDIAFWTKFFYPMAIFVMLVLSMPFAYMSARAGGMAVKIFFGIMIGIFYYALNNIFAFLGALESVPPMISAMIPSLFMLLCGALAMWFVEKRT
ncbi:MAG: LPS export ABC transporter permease LptG [Burkholderiales bacterium]|nr:LPS export ABC transporter permease LptG [Burkholderiales bacterium]